MKELLILRMNILGGMYQYLKDNCEDYRFMCYWCGDIVQNPTEETLMAVAQSDELWTDTCVRFGEVLKQIDGEDL